MTSVHFVARICKYLIKNNAINEESTRKRKLKTQWQKDLFPNGRHGDN